MLNISAISGTGLQHPGQVGMSQSADYVSKSIQKQIEYLQKQLQELSSNDTMSMEEKQKKQQELQMQINDLTAQLRQHQMEEKKERLEAAAPSQENEEQKKMRSMLSAETALDHARIEGSVSTRLEGRSNVLQREIRLDSDRLGSSKGKLEELSEVKQRIRDAKNSESRLLGEAGKILKEEAEENMEKSSEAGSKNETDKMDSDTEFPKKENVSSLADATENPSSGKPDVFIYTQEGKPSPGENRHKLTAHA